MSAAIESPLQATGFRWLLLYRICTLLSYQIVAVTVGWHVYELTGDPLALGLIGLAEVIPFQLLDQDGGEANATPAAPTPTRTTSFSSPAKSRRTEGSRIRP